MESNYENLMCLAGELKSAIVQAAKIHAIVALVIANWTKADAKKLVEFIEGETR